MTKDEARTLLETIVKRHGLDHACLWHLDIFVAGMLAAADIAAVTEQTPTLPATAAIRVYTNLLEAP